MAKLGDVVRWWGVWEDEERESFRSERFERLVAFEGHFKPVPANRVHGRFAEKKEENCRFWLSEQSCARGAQCRYRHLDVESEEFRMARKDFLENLEKEKSERM